MNNLFETIGPKSLAEQNAALQQVSRESAIKQKALVTRNNPDPKKIGQDSVELSKQAVAMAQSAVESNQKLVQGSGKKTQLRQILDKMA